MKKFSVLLVAILALMMLFVSCDNEPKKRAATKEDGEIVMGLVSCYYNKNLVLVDNTTVVAKGNLNEGTITFKEAVYKDKEDNVVAVLNGTMAFKPGKEPNTVINSVDFGDGTKYNGKDHTLLANVVMNEEGVVSYEIMLDGVILTDFVFD